MTANLKYYETFNNKMGEFLKDLITVFPDDKDLKLFKNSFNLLKINSTEKPCRLYYSVIQEYKQNIFNKDESFFLDKDYSDIIKDDVDINNSLIQKLKENWLYLDKDQKNIVWNYLILLCKLSDKCHSR
jgi:hypothetical protein